VREAGEFLLDHDNSRVLAGGTDLLVKKDPRIQSLVDITRLNLDYVRINDGTIRIGACTTFRHLEEAVVLKKQPYSSLVDAAETIGGPAIRNVATIGGNLCSAVPSIDSAPPLMVLDSWVKMAARDEERDVRLEEFFAGAKKTVLKKGELLTEVQIPKSPPHTGACFLKLGRSARDIAIVNVAARITLGREKRCEDARIALGAVGPVPLRARKAEEELEKGGRKAILRASSMAAEETEPITDVRASAEYRGDMCRVLTKRALTMAFQRAEAA
jgi:carbon-monoxide dehydrogenase medium subunit